MLLEQTRSALFSDKSRFDHCFVTSSNQRLPGKLKASIKISGPKLGKLTLVDISTSEEAKDDAGFERCVRLVINRLDIDHESKFINDRVAILSPSWVEPTPTIIEPSRVQVPAGEVCMLLIRQFYKFKKWDVRKAGKQKVSDNFVKFGDEDIIVCSSQNIPAHFNWNLKDVRLRYPSEDLDGYIVIDGFE
ncbi:MAG TPA: hypothetical protein VE954_19435 [Oligoflexus sp.]|uniref:hypothetical protein n=1 Tax=Oligoflexus sp. TaxID=1971216 RepID=UPI002D60041F|nr:hypothetical protein [Oligoflexus sp.]HYX35275.1 hypothetical protein [Oligoflexus sp.]